MNRKQAADVLLSNIEFHTSPLLDKLVDELYGQQQRWNCYDCYKLLTMIIDAQEEDPADDATIRCLPALKVFTVVALDC